MAEDKQSISDIIDILQSPHSERWLIEKSANKLEIVNPVSLFGPMITDMINELGISLIKIKEPVYEEHNTHKGWFTMRCIPDHEQVQILCKKNNSRELYATVGHYESNTDSYYFKDVEYERFWKLLDIVAWKPL